MCALILSPVGDAQQTTTPPQNIHTSSKNCGGHLTFGKLSAGELLFCDSDYSFTEVPTDLEGATTVQTSVSDTSSDANDSQFICFDITQASAVFILSDAGVDDSDSPQWMQVSEQDNHTGHTT